jgi:hypothetical protein
MTGDCPTAAEAPLLRRALAELMAGRRREARAEEAAFLADHRRVFDGLRGAAVAEVARRLDLD